MKEKKEKCLPRQVNGGRNRDKVKINSKKYKKKSTSVAGAKLNQKQKNNAGLFFSFVLKFNPQCKCVEKKLIRGNYLIINIFLLFLIVTRVIIINIISLFEFAGV